MYTFAISCFSFLPISTIAQNNQYFQEDRQYTDRNGQIYYINQQGQVYYVDSEGYVYFRDKDGNLYYVDNDGYTYRLDQNEQPYYTDQNGRPYYLDRNNNQNGQIQDLNKESRKYNDDIYLGNTSDRYRTNQANRYKQQEDIQTSYPNIQLDNVRFAIGGGYSTRLGDLLDNSQVNKDLKNGFNIDGEAQYFLMSQ